MKRLALSLLVLSIVYFSSCDPEPSEDVNQDRIKTDYRVDYNDHKIKTEAVAQFWFGSTPLKITSPAQILAEDHGLEKRDILGIVDYTRKFKERIDDVTFEYRDHDSRTYTNIVSIPEDIQLPSSLTSISKSEDVLISWEGNPVGTDEIVYLEIIDDDIIFTLGNSNRGSKSIFIEANSLDEELDGRMEFRMVRHKDWELQEAPRGGKVSSNFFSKILHIDITD
ncbi:MAG: hypothetical protein JXR03_19510 [Cyclobacteriaceae bacterium]